jgi:glycine C-acetyltransferase
MLGDEARAAAFSRSLIADGVFAVRFSYPVVPMGTARIRTQMSAAHSLDDLNFALVQFERAREAVSD